MKYCTLEKRKEIDTTHEKKKNIWKRLHMRPVKQTNTKRVTKWVKKKQYSKKKVIKRKKKTRKDKHGCNTTEKKINKSHGETKHVQRVIA